jgi:hypothetical protein
MSLSMNCLLTVPSMVLSSIPLQLNVQSVVMNVVKETIYKDIFLSRCASRLLGNA